MKVLVFSLVLGFGFNSVSAQVQNVLPDYSESEATAIAFAYVDAKPAYEDPYSPPDVGVAYYIEDTDDVHAVAEGGIADTSPDATASYDGEAIARVFPSNVTCASGHSGSIASLGGEALVNSADEYLLPSFGLPTQENATVSGVYSFAVTPPPAGFVWVASGSFEFQYVGVSGYLGASVSGPGFQVGTDNMSGLLSGTVEDVLDGETRQYEIWGGSQLKDTWSTIVAVGPQNPITLGAATSSGDLGSVQGIGSTHGFNASANAFNSIESIQLVEAATLPAMQTVYITTQPN